jgi:hypothetical protein
MSLPLTRSRFTKSESAQNATAPKTIRAKVNPTGEIHPDSSVLETDRFNPKRMFVTNIATCPCHFSLFMLFHEQA